MLVRVWFFTTNVLTALLMSTSLAHTLEMPMKMAVDGVAWMTFQHTLYRYFAFVGAPIELASIMSAGDVADVAWRPNGRRLFASCR